MSDVVRQFVYRDGEATRTYTYHDDDTVDVSAYFRATDDTVSMVMPRAEADANLAMNVSMGYVED